VDDGEDHRVARVALADEREHALLAVVAVDPLEAVAGKVVLVERGLAAVERVEIPHPALEPRVQRPIEQREVDGALVIPFAPLAELPAHEEQLLAGMEPHVAEERAEIRELLP